MPTIRGPLPAGLDVPCCRLFGPAASAGLTPGEGSVSKARVIGPDRRKFRRSVVGIPVQGVLHGAAPDDCHRVVGFHVLSLSRGGAGVVSQEALVPAQPLTLFFPPVGSGKGCDTRGQVVRCDDLGNHYSVGIAFEEPWPDPDEIPANWRRFSWP